MHLLTRICLQNWYLIDAKDIEVEGATALVGPTGAGKSSIQDAIQTVITGANQNRLTLNPSASGKSTRTVLEYCLGMTRDPSEGGKPLRTSCETVLALVFRDEETNEPITVGVALSARQGDSREEVLSRFILPGHAYSVEEARRRDGLRSYLAPWSEIAANLRARHPGFEEYRSSAERFTADMLAAMRGPGQPPNARHFLRAFANAHAFKPIFDPTVFVREFILEPDPLDIARVRTSIDTWHELERTIAEIESRLRRVTRLSDRFRNWGRARVKVEAARFMSAAAEARRIAHDVVSTSAVLVRRSEELAAERAILASRRQWIRDWDAEIRSRRALLQSDDASARIRQIEIETSVAERDAREGEARWTRLRETVAAIARLAPLSPFMAPRHSRAVEAAREAMSIMREGQPPVEAIRGRGDRLQELIDAILELDGWDTRLLERADALAEEMRSLQREVEEMEQSLARSSSGGAALSREAMRLLDALARRGIDPVPLCDVVEVVEEDWQYAVEALLGRGREAIIVDPARLNEVFDLMWRDRDVYAGCTLVKTTQTRSVDPRPRGSIIEAITSENPHALAFLNVRIGAFMKADTEADLDRLDRGVMRNGKTASGMGLSVQRSLRELILGRTARDRSGEALRDALAPKRTRLAEMRNEVRLLREAARIIPLAIETIRSGMGPFDLEHALVSSRIRSEALLRDRKAVEAGAGNALLTEIEGLEAEREAYAREVAEEIEPKVEELQGQVAEARAKNEVARNALRQAVAARRKAWRSLSADEVQRILRLDAEVDEPDALGTCKAFRQEVARQEATRKDPKAWLASFRNERKAILGNVEAEARREQVGALRDLTEYGSAWGADIPEIGPDTMTVGYAWAIGEQARLEGNELRHHREACSWAAAEMRRMLKEDLLARLAEKLGKVHDRLDTLNRLLARHRFTGQVYSFTAAVNQRYARLHDLAMRVGGSAETSGEVLTSGLADEDVSAAVAELEGMIEGAEDTALLADYRNYFTFEIIMTDRNGGRTTMSSRAVKGSGGEAQAPFYVAIAASLASAYFPGLSRGRPKGMGLALFDEAFNKLDVPNTQALLTFFSDMGLQLMIAGPEDKRATFTEVLDTIILVNKSLDGNSVYVDAEFPGSLAKRELARINPDHVGIEGFRQIAAE
ncbi:SbcC/MukB-like Walker B domain-containing protein [Microvirga massiliensis]|uniref:SbcC/MukB-like Walker B domain-containing protein n=1 Tax=Microvirga massiliensis TaxID=1033741 RepID=UPI00062B9D57|nr:SbcC/MukB-like Walker B domain-containing protein [Microvirga massiliensis]